ncbi:MAG: DUF4338 domain-containing protein [Elusimicrobia bacterium]|nr:DUF4338 domain-containing protein [Elusimicrobiota bacterium]
MAGKRKVLLRYRGRDLSEEDASFIRELIARHPRASRRRLSTLLCEAWGWRQANGALSDFRARGLMLALHRAGHVALPPPRCVPPNNVVRRPPPAPVLLDTSPIEVPLAQLQPLEFVLVRRTPYEVLFDGLIHHYHYLGYVRPVGEHLKYLVLSPAGRPLAALAFSSAPRHLGPRDRFIGWTAQARRANVRGVAYNPRFLIPPWVRVPHLASHVLARVLRGLSGDWQRIYGHPVHFVETFVDPTRFKGTCYRAANWVHLGRTTGRGKDDQTNKPNRPLKDVLGYPLDPRFRELLGRLP